ncbi:MAG: site-specific DNA-methyltransferase [Syntrophales bacterium]|jgi:adenine-specific DNA-methyltransferase|nr:site-specific DNA-methyltransferase [Syntrophales bacterium]
MPVKYIPYYPNTVTGQAILDNITRTRRVLRYRDNGKVVDRIKRGMPYYELEKIEEVRSQTDIPLPNKEEEHGEFQNLLIRGECISACAYLQDQGVKVDLVYIDPPFASGADYAKKVYLRRNPEFAEKIANAEEEMDLEELRSFEEKMYGDIWNKEDYLNWMYENLTAIKSVMSETASIYVHLDWHIGHYVKVLMDEVFGEDNYKNELIWQKTTAPKAQSGQFANVHDMIYLYSCTDDYLFNKLYTDYSEQYLQDFYKYETTDGRKYRISDFSQAGQGSPMYFGKDGKSLLLEPPSGKHWIWGQNKITDGVINKRIILSTNNVPGLIRYLDEMPGNPLRDIWTDLSAIGPGANENANYATQKPEALLERVIQASSNEGMIIADFFGGSGVTAKVAHDLDRKFIHVDVGINSIQTTRDRLIAVGAQFDIYDIQDGVSLFRNPVQTMDKLKRLIAGLKNEDSIDSFWEGAVNDSKLGLMPVYVPNLLDHSTKVLDIPLMNRIMNEALPDLPDGVKQVIVYYVDIENEPELKKFIADYNATNIQIELRDLKSILDECVINDEADYQLEEVESGFAIEFKSFVSDRLIQKIDVYNQKKLLNDAKNGSFDENGSANGDNGNAENGNGSGSKKPFTPIEISNRGLELIELVSLDCTNSDGVWKNDMELKVDKNGHVILNGRKTKEYWHGKIVAAKKPLRMKIRNIAGDESVINLQER